MPAEFGSGEVSSWPAVGRLSLCPQWQRVSQCSGLSSYMDTVPSDQSPSLMTSFRLHYFLRGLSLDTVTLGLGFQHMDLVGTQSSPQHPSMPSSVEVQPSTWDTLLPPAKSLKCPEPFSRNIYK